MANIAGDLIVHGRDTAEHDKNLNSVLERLSEKQLTANAERCTFRINKVIFMGLLLSKHGVGPTEENVRAVTEASQPQTLVASWGSWDSVPGLYLILPLLLIPLGDLREKENRLCGVKSRRSHFKN